MQRLSLSILLALAAGGAAAATPSDTATTAAVTDAAHAREELADLRRQIAEMSRRMAELSRELGDAGPRGYALRYLSDPQRAMAGLVLAGDEQGLRIAALTPDGPAARAGLRSGDRVVSINDVSIKTAPTPKGAADADAADRSLEAARAQLGALKDGDAVRIGWRRDDGSHGTATFKAERREAHEWPRLFAGEVDNAVNDDALEARLREAERTAERAAARAERDGADIERRAHLAVERANRRLAESGPALERAQRAAAAAAMPWWGFNLATVDAELGRYFGTDHGALVLATHEGEPTGLKAGDVIQQVGDHAVRRAEDALRALRDGPAGKDVTVTVLRERKAQRLSLRMPESKRIFDAMPPLPPLPPMAPLPPEPPSPSALTAPAPPPPPAAPPRNDD